MKPYQANGCRCHAVTVLSSSANYHMFNITWQTLIFTRVFIHLDVFAVLLDCGVLSTVGWRHRCTDTVSGWQTAAVNHLYSLPPPDHHTALFLSPSYTNSLHRVEAIRVVAVFNLRFPDSYSGSFRFDCNPSRDEERVQLCLSRSPLVITGWSVVYWLLNVTVLYSWQYRILIL